MAAGGAQASLHIKDDDQDVTYEADRVALVYETQQTGYAGKNRLRVGSCTNGTW
jgi:hypothetical protein